MENDGDVNVSKMPMQVPLNANFLSAASLGVSQDLKMFLEKPFPVVRSVFQTSDIPGSTQIHQVFNQMQAQEIYAHKLRGFLGIRATVVLRLQLNAERFMQGRYILAFMPMVTQSWAPNGYANSAARSKQMRCSATTVTQLPHVQFDLNCDTQATLEIPYISPYSHYSLTTGHGDVGSYFIYNYSPLATGDSGSTTCQYTIWMSLKDVELVAPTLPYVPLASQMAPVKGYASKRGAVTEQEAQSVDQGPISSVMRKVSKAADVLSEIPLISMVTSQVSWAAKIAASTASVFGWAKPIALGPPMRMIESKTAFWNNPDAMDYSMPLSMMNTNLIEALPGFAGSDRDEMSIDYLKCVPAFYNIFFWNVTNTSGDTLFTELLDPGRYTYPISEGANPYNVFTPVSFLAKQFHHYRGSLRFTFKIVKTEFHSGRLTFSYAPIQQTGVDFSLEDSSYLIRETLDIRMGNEFSFVVPYSSIQTYRDVGDPYGLVKIHVLNELVAPATVAQSVSILVEVSAAPDMEFAFPACPTMLPYVPITSQSGMSKADECTIVSSTVATSNMFDDQLTSSRFCVGEKVLSLASFLKRSLEVRYYTSAFQQPIILPFAISVIVTEAGPLSSRDNIVADTYSLFASAFALSRGGIRHKFVPPTDNSHTMCKATLFKIRPNGGVFTSYSEEVQSLIDYSIQNQSNALGMPSVDRALEIQTPQYGKFHSRVNQELMIGGELLQFRMQDSKTSPDLVIQFQSYADTNFATYRSVADDFQLGYFTGFPPCRLSTS